MARFTITEFSVASVSGNAVNGAFIVTTTVVGSDAVAFSTVGQKIEFCPGPSGFLGFSVPSLRKALKLSATICASTAAPEWNTRPAGSVNVHVSRSSETVHESKSAGW